MNNFEHRVMVPLKFNSIWNIEGAVQEIKAIQDWLDQATGWQEDQYETKLLVSKRALDVWIKDEKVAVLCALRWL